MKSYKCPKCSAVNTYASWDAVTAERYGTESLSITTGDMLIFSFYTCPKCGEDIYGEEVTEVAAPYDTERGVTWYASLFTEDDAADLPQSDEEITPEAAAELARKYGYDNFEIVRTETEIKRYKTAEVSGV